MAVEFGKWIKTLLRWGILFIVEEEQQKMQRSSKF